MLVALRLWASRWASKRIFLRVRGDSVSALTMVLNMTARGEGPSIIAREMALDVADALYVPNVAIHLPGAANCTADLLSRLEQKGRPALPAALRWARERRPQRRTQQWWRAI